MNINYLASGCINSIFRIVKAQYYEFIAQINIMGIITPQYANPITLNVNIQLVDKQKLIQIDNYNRTTIYKAFWINNDQISGLNRNINTGGDYFEYQGLKYKIVGIENNFANGWICIYCAQGVLNAD